jgi:hypothetical protein
MPSVIARHVTRRIAEVARKTAVQVNPIVEGTVVSRNPDGSLNVLVPGGGCQRVAPRANVRVGQKIKLGTEPSLGSQTNLPLVTVTLSPSTVPCPGDPRDGCEHLIGVPCPEPTSGEFAQAAELYAIEWKTLNPTEAYPGAWGVWGSRFGASPSQLRINVNKQVQESVNRRAANYSGHIVPPFADEVNYVAARVFLTFDTRAIPAGSHIVSAELQVSIKGNTPNRIQSDHSERVRVLPGLHSLFPSVANWDLIMPVVLAEVPLGEMIDAGPDPAADEPYPFAIPLAAPDGGTLDDWITGGGYTGLVLAMRLDSEPGSVLPAPGLFTTGRETLPSGTPDDKVHVQPGAFVIDHINYFSASPSDFPLSQRDGNGEVLTGTESYVAALFQPPGNDRLPVLIKGEKSDAAPRRPPLINEGPGGVLGGIVLSWITVGCSHGDPSVITSADIVEDPVSRQFSNLGNPNETRASINTVLFNHSDDVLLRVTYSKPSMQ